MRRNIISHLLAASLATLLATAAPLERRSYNNNVSNEFQDIDSFPTPNAQQLLNTERRAHGTLSNSTPPARVDPDTILSLQIIAAQEQFEAAYFQQLLTNVTNNVTGFVIQDAKDRKTKIDALTAIVAQEELHALDAITALRHFNQTPVAACLYNFPVSTFDEAISLAQTFTSVVLGTLQNIVVNMGQHGDAALTQDISSVIGQEGEQQGFFRVLGGHVPSELPFLTNSVRDFAFNALNQDFIVPGSCPNVDQIKAFNKLHVMQPLTVTKSFNLSASTGSGTSSGSSETVELSFSLPNGTKAADYQVAYINQQNVPLVLPYSVLSQNGQSLSVQAPFPYTEHLLNGLTILAIVPTSSAANLTSNQAVADVTLAGPGLVVVN